MNHIPWLTIAIFAPLVGAALTMLARKAQQARTVALLFSLVPLLIGAWALVDMTPGVGEYALTEKADWITVEVGDVSFNVTYHLGLDGLSAPLFALTALLVTASIIYSWEQRENAPAFFALLLMLDTAVLGVFSALDLFLFYVFWEVVLIPMFFLIAMWGGPNRTYAAVKFFVYTFVASLVMLLGFMAVYFHSGAGTFDLLAILAGGGLGGRTFQVLTFGALFFGFIVKMPVVPFHTWLPWAHVEAPTAGSVLLAGVLLKMGAYGILRIAMPLLPFGAKVFVPIMIVLGILSILYGAMVALAQTDLKKMVALSSVSHMGMVLLAMALLNEIGIVGAIYMMVAHGIISPLAFMVCGSFGHGLGTRDIRKLGGVARKVPTLAFFTSVAFLASLGLPGFAGFIAEITIFVATFEAHTWLLVLPIGAVAITAAYYIWAMKRSLYGPLTDQIDTDHVHDMPWYETTAAALLTLFAVLLGVWPNLLTDYANPAAKAVLTMMGVA